MSDNKPSSKPSSRGVKPTGSSSKAEEAKKGIQQCPLSLSAMFRRSKKQDSTMMQYYIVIGAFVAVCVAAVIYVLLNPKKSFASMQVIDESQILVHNG